MGWDAAMHIGLYWVVCRSVVMRTDPTKNKPRDNTLQVRFCIENISLAPDLDETEKGTEKKSQNTHTQF